MLSTPKFCSELKGDKKCKFSNNLNAISNIWSTGNGVEIGNLEHVLNVLHVRSVITNTKLVFTTIRLFEYTSAI